MMSQPNQPPDHPKPEDVDRKSERDPTGVSPNGVPPDATQAEATGLPTSDRNATETAAHPAKHSGG